MEEEVSKIVLLPASPPRRLGDIFILLASNAKLQEPCLPEMARLLASLLSCARLGAKTSLLRLHSKGVGKRGRSEGTRAAWAAFRQLGYLSAERAPPEKEGR